MSKIKCFYCGQENEFVNYCSFDCMVQQAKAAGGEVIAPNNLPIRVVRADGTMLEDPHADHPDYKFPIVVEYIGPKDEDYDDFGIEHHAVIYADEHAVLTLYECCYNLFINGKIRGNKFRSDWKISDESMKKIDDYVNSKL